MNDPRRPARAGGFPGFIPPILGLAAAAALRGVQPFPLLEGPARWIAGAVLVAVGTGFGAGAFARMRAARTSPNPYRRQTALVEDGPFRVSRNPMYVGMVFQYLGLAVLLALPLAVLLAPVVIAAIHAGSIRPEERFMAATFPESWPPYAAKVRPWL